MGTGKRRVAGRNLTLAPSRDGALPDNCLHAKEGEGNRVPYWGPLGASPSDCGRVGGKNLPLLGKKRQTPELSGKAPRREGEETGRKSCAPTTAAQGRI